MIGIARLSTRDADFDTRLAGLLAFDNFVMNVLTIGELICRLLLQYTQSR